MVRPPHYLKHISHRFVLILLVTGLLGLTILPKGSLSKAKILTSEEASFSNSLRKQETVGNTATQFPPAVTLFGSFQGVNRFPGSELIVCHVGELGSKVNQQDDTVEAARNRAFTDFETWTKTYSLAGDPGSLEKGIELAKRRKALLKDLIFSDPERALAFSVSPDMKRKLPSEIGVYLEEHLNGYGDYMVLVSDQIDPASGSLVGTHTERMVIVQGKIYKAAVYGRWLNMTSKKNIPLNGIVIDGVMAINESPVRMLSRAELADLSASGRLVEGEITADIGGEVHYFQNEQDLSTFTQALVSREMMIGPDTEEHKNTLSTADSKSLTADSAWTEGPKAVLFIRIDFPERPGEPVDVNNQPLTVARAQSLMDTQVNPFYVSNSYNKTSMQTTIMPVVRMPQPQSFYFKNSGALFKDAENAARSAGFDPNNFNLEVIAMSYNQGFDYAGVGSVGARGAAINGSFDLRVTAHELGHNYGLNHANLWRTTDGTVIGNGNNVEYGNSFDTMGGGGDAKYHFNAQYKRRLNWLTDANVQTVTTDGVYRIFAQDSPTPGGIRAIKIRKNDTKNYWVEFRQLFTNNPNAMNGAIINWDYLSANFAETQLLDMTPNTSTDATDSPLLIGRNFYDNENRIRMTVLGKGNTAPESLDVKVELNVGCTFSLGQTTQSFSASGGEGNITVNTQGGCRVVPTSNDSWLYAAPSDTGTVRYIVAANYDSQPRTGTISVAGQTFTVQQGAVTTACAGQPSGLVAWWRGEGNALDQTGVNNGTLVNNMTFGGGKVGGGFLGNYSNNAGVVQVPDSPSLALNRSMTFEGWLRLDSYGGTVIERRDDMSSGNLVASYEIDVNSSGQLAFYIGFNRSQGTGTGSSALPLNQFVHFAATLDDATSQMKIYINGSLVNQVTIAQRPYDLDPNANPRVNIGNINGITDELSVYNRALSAAQIQAIYNAGIASTGATGKCLSGCTFSLGQTSQSFAANGGEGSIPLNTQSGCVPPAGTSNDSWLSAISTDVGIVRYIVAANYDPQPRTGTITVAGQTFTVQQGAATTACIPRPSGLVAWWRGEGSALDQTGVNNGTLIKNMTFGGGKVGGGFLGDYNNNAGVVEVSDSSSLALNRSMTFEGWLKVNSYGGTVIERRTTSVGSYQVWILSSGELLFTVWYNDSSGTGVYSNPLPLGQFVHFAASLDDGTGQIKMYINGSLVRQFTITQRPNTLSGALINVGNINGITDELSVYNRVLTASEIQAIYNAGIAATGAAGKCLSSSPVQVTISGRVTNNSTGLSGVTMTLSGSQSATVTTDTNGNYAFADLLAGGNYTVTPSRTNFTFNPVSQTFNNLSADQTANFTAASIPTTVQLSATSYSIGEGQSFATITVNRTGDLSAASTVKYATSDTTNVNFQCNPLTAGQPTGIASRKCDYHIAVGRLRFAAGESSKQITISIIDDVYVEGAETFQLSLSSPVGATLGSNSSATITITDNDTAGQANPIDGTRFYVRQLYVDLLSREPDPAGWDGWTNRINLCGQPGQPPPPCDRVTVGGDGFLRSGEFFDRQFFVLRLYRTGLGRILVYDEVGDLAYVSGFLTASDLELNKQELVADIMARPEFANKYNGLSNSAFVDTLLQTAGVTVAQADRDAWVNALNFSTKTRAQVFREISERPEVSSKYLHEAQVVSAYYGFFTRNPDGAYTSYLTRLDAGQINLGDLANAFINAQEYRQRFGP